MQSVNHPEKQSCQYRMQYHDDLRLRDGQLGQFTCATSAHNAHCLNVHDGAGINSPCAASGRQAAIPDFLAVAFSTKGVGRAHEDPVWPVGND